MWNMPVDLVLCCQMGVGGPALGRSRIRRRHPASAAGVRRTGIRSPLGGFRSAQGMRSVWHGDRVAKLTSYYPCAKRARWQIESDLASAGPVAPACLLSHGRVRGGFLLSQRSRQSGRGAPSGPLQQLGGIMRWRLPHRGRRYEHGFLGPIPELADRGVELHLVANTGAG